MKKQAPIKELNRVKEIKDLWGETFSQNPELRDKYIEPVFTTLNTRSGQWKRRLKRWRDWFNLDTGITGEEAKLGSFSNNPDFNLSGLNKAVAEEAVFDQYLLEVLFHWYCNKNGSWYLKPDKEDSDKGGKILDPFSGSCISGIMAHTLGYKFTGIELRPEIVEENYRHAKRLLHEDNMPNWINGDSNVVLDDLVFEEFDLINSCPPYVDLVKYSKKNPIKGDISLLKYSDFLPPYRSIIFKCCRVLKKGGYATITVGEVRGADGYYLPFLHDTIKAFEDCGVRFYNSAILIGAVGTAPMRAASTFERGDGKLVNTHQTVLIFKKPL